MSAKGKRQAEWTCGLTEQQARELAKLDRNYSARCIRGQWMVWDAQSDHHVEFDMPEQTRGNTEMPFLQYDYLYLQGDLDWVIAFNESRRKQK